jgi:hypothetical protein
MAESITSTGSTTLSKYKIKHYDCLEEIIKRIEDDTTYELGATDKKKKQGKVPNYKDKPVTPKNIKKLYNLKLSLKKLEDLIDKEELPNFYEDVIDEDTGRNMEQYKPIITNNLHIMYKCCQSLWRQWQYSNRTSKKRLALLKELENDKIHYLLSIEKLKKENKKLKRDLYKADPSRTEYETFEYFQSSDSSDDD